MLRSKTLNRERGRAFIFLHLISLGLSDKVGEHAFCSRYFIILQLAVACASSHSSEHENTNTSYSSKWLCRDAFDWICQGGRGM